jgi:WD40 repeat protein
VRIVAIVAALLAVSSAQASQPSPAPLYGVVWSGRDGNLSRLDPSTLEPVGAALTFREFGAWSFSPDEDRLAVGGSYAPDVRFVDMASLQTIRTVLLGPSGAVERIDWLGPTTVVVLHASPAGTRVVWLDTTSGRVLKRAKLGADPFQTASAGGRVVALLPPRKGIGAGRLAVVGRDRRVRIVRLPKIRIGSTQPSAGGLFRRVSPGLAVDPVSGHA